MLARHQDLQLHDTLWGSTTTTPHGRRCAPQAIRAALRKGADYAAALGGTLVRVVHVADAGLLSRSVPEVHGRASLVEQKSRGGSGPGDAPSLTPVPQRLIAAIDAGVLATRLPGCSVSHPTSEANAATSRSRIVAESDGSRPLVTPPDRGCQSIAMPPR